MSSSCAGCHRVRGTTADGELGPDLTHLAARETIGAGLMPLTAENLADFVSRPQGDKLGVTMPPTEITDSELHDVPLRHAGAVGVRELGPASAQAYRTL